MQAWLVWAVCFFLFPRAFEFGSFGGLYLRSFFLHPEDFSGFVEEYSAFALSEARC